MRAQCPYCGHHIIVGADSCDKCLHTLTDSDIPRPGKDKVQKTIMTEKVSDFISDIPPIMVRPDASMKEVVEKMQALPQKGCVLVCDDNKKLLGIVSIRDLLLKIAGVLSNEDLEHYPVKNIMTANPECLDKDVPISFALHKMSIGKFRHVPILDKGIPIGVVSIRDIIDYLNHIL